MSSSDLQSGYWALVWTGISLGSVESKTLLIFKAVFILKFALKKQLDRIYSSQSRLLFFSSYAKWFLRRHRNSGRKRRPLYRPVTPLEASQGCGQQDLGSVSPKVRVKPRTRLFVSLCPHTTSKVLSVFCESRIHFEQTLK